MSLGLVAVGASPGAYARASSGHDSPTASTSASPATARVTVSPQPDTPDASAKTQISFLGPAVQEFGRIIVRGSRSGPHPGTLRPYSDGRGASFVPHRRFRSGEKVSVRLDLKRQGVVHHIRFHFKVAHAAELSPSPLPPPPEGTGPG